jgi:cell cycle arrest protein BUB3
MWNGEHTVASAGWDSNCYIWDARASNVAHKGVKKAVASIPLKDKAYSMDVDPSSGERLVISLAGRQTAFIDVRKLGTVDADTGVEPVEANIVLERESSLKYQTRVIRFFPNGSAIATGSIEGRVGIEFLEELKVDSGGKKKYAFKCHRVGDTVYPVNAIAFHPKYGTFATGGCDGTVVTWDGLNKKKLVTVSKCATSIAALAFNSDGTELAIASSYTFEDGERDHPRDEILVRQVLDSEVRPKSK